MTEPIASRMQNGKHWLTYIKRHMRDAAAEVIELELEGKGKAAERARQAARRWLVHELANVQAERRGRQKLQGG
jgi:hypothetical protein